MASLDKLVLAPFVILAATFLHEVSSFSQLPPTAVPAGIHTTTAQTFSRSRTRPLNAFVLDTASTASVIDTFFQTQPELAAFTVCSFKASAADILAQKKEESSSIAADEHGPENLSIATTSPLSQNSALLSSTLPINDDADQQKAEIEDAGKSITSSTTAIQGIDFQRNLGFLMYGGLYTGVAQHYLYNYVYPMLLGVDESPTLVLEKVLVDNLIAAPFLCLPVAYAFKAAFTAESGNLSFETMKDGLKKYIQDVTDQGLLFKYWSIWLPVQFLTFGVIPEQYRVPFVAMVSFFWMAILSTLSNADDKGASTTTSVSAAATTTVQ